MPISTETILQDSSSLETDLITLPRFIIENQKIHTKAKGDFSLVLNSLQFAFKFISQTIRKSELINLMGPTGQFNSTGDQQKKLDLVGDEIFINAMKQSGIIRVVVSEEQPELIILNGNENKYSICCDPIDGSSNLEAGVAVGTIVSIFKLRENSQGEASDVLRHGYEMCGACYAMYGSSTHLLLCMGQSVDAFILDNNIGEFILTNPNLHIPIERPIYSVNEGNGRSWDPKIKSFIDSLKDDDEKNYSLRYIGSMVADVHRTMLYGGLFAYPCDKKNPNGKLRLLYEAFPMAYLVEHAGGKAVNDRGERILDLKPEHIHDKSSIWIGSFEEVSRFVHHLENS